MEKVPCKGCRDRTAVCHATCKLYSEYAARRKACHEARAAQTSVQDFRHDGYTKYLRENHRRKGRN
jgi:hypothetical protein